MRGSIRRVLKQMKNSMGNCGDTCQLQLCCAKDASHNDRFPPNNCLFVGAEAYTDKKRLSIRER